MAGRQEMKIHFEERVLHKEPRILSDQSISNIRHGSNNEPNAIATFTKLVIPFYHPDAKFYEVGSYDVSPTSNPFLLVLPDGILSQENSPYNPLPTLACEFKCPVPNPFKTPVHMNFQ